MDRSGKGVNVSDTRLQITVVKGLARCPRVRVEAWDRDLFFDDFIASGVTDDSGHCVLSFDDEKFKEAFVDRRADVFFRVFDGDTLLADTRDSVVCNLKPGLHEIAIRVPEQGGPDEDDEPGESGAMTIHGRAVLSPGWKPGVRIEAFADAALTRPLGAAAVDRCGRFAIEGCAAAREVWFRWAQGDQQGRSPLLQPFAGGAHFFR